MKITQQKVIFDILIGLGFVENIFLLRYLDFFLICPIEMHWKLATMGRISVKKSVADNLKQIHSHQFLF